MMVQGRGEWVDVSIHPKLEPALDEAEVVRMVDNASPTPYLSLACRTGQPSGLYPMHPYAGLS